MPTAPTRNVLWHRTGSPVSSFPGEMRCTIDGFDLEPLMAAASSAARARRESFAPSPRFHDSID
jgi:hypothetical protein